MLDCQDTGTSPMVDITSPLPAAFAGDFSWVIAGYYRANTVNNNLVVIEDNGTGQALQVLWQHTGLRFRVIHSNDNQRTMNLATGAGLGDGTFFLLAGHYDADGTSSCWLKAPGLATVTDTSITSATNVAGLTVDTYELFAAGWQGAMAFALGTGSMDVDDFEDLYDAYLGTNDAEAGGGSLAKLLDEFTGLSGVTLKHHWGFRHYVVGVNGSSTDVEGANVGDRVDASSTSKLQIYDADATPARADLAANVNAVNGDVYIVSPYELSTS